MLPKIKARLRTHFGFSKTEANGVLVLLLLMGLCLLIPQGLKWYDSKYPKASHDQDIVLLEQTLALLEVRKQNMKQAHKVDTSHCAQQAQVFDINTTNATQLCGVKGIGPVLAARIIKFRNKLGGFIDTKQYQEVFGLRSDVIKRLQKASCIRADFQPVKLNINIADVQVLAAHPYLTYQQARCIVCHRIQHGPFSVVETLRTQALIDEVTWKKVKHYLTTLQYQPSS